MSFISLMSAPAQKCFTPVIISVFIRRSSPKSASAASREVSAVVPRTFKVPGLDSIIFPISSSLSTLIALAVSIKTPAAFSPKFACCNHLPQQRTGPELLSQFALEYLKYFETGVQSYEVSEFQRAHRMVCPEFH